MSLNAIKTAKITEKGQISIPKAIREQEGFREGQKVAVYAYSDRIEIRPLQQLLPKHTPETALLSEKALAQDWLSKEEEDAWKDL